MKKYTLSTGETILSTTDKPNPLQIEGIIKSSGIYVYADLSIYNLSENSINTIISNGVIKLEIDGIIAFEGKVSNHDLKNINNYVDKVFTIYCFSEILHKNKISISKKKTTAQECLSEIVNQYNNNASGLPVIRESGLTEIDQTSMPIPINKFTAIGSIEQTIDKLANQLNYDKNKDSLSTQINNQAIRVCVKKEKIIITDNNPAKSSIIKIPILNIINGSVAIGIATATLECLIIPDVSIENLIQFDFGDFYNLQNTVNINLVPIAINKNAKYIVKSFTHKINYYDEISTTSLELLLS